MKHSSIKRFTLIEMLVILVVIGILIGMLLPAIISVIRDSSDQEAKADCNMIYSAIKQYMNDYNNYYPESSQPAVDGSDSDGTVASYSTTIATLAGGNINKKNYLPEIKGAPSGTFLDPWEQNYVIVLDKNHDGTISSSAHANITSDLEDEKIAVSTTDSSGNVIGSWAGN